VVSDKTSYNLSFSAKACPVACPALSIFLSLW
jgi:hypothetical protein